jgi:hypothetical protein
MSGPQGWYDPISNAWRRPDHAIVQQVNVRLKPLNTFTQFVGNIYWLDIRLSTQSGLAGWKTSFDHFMDAAVVSNATPPVHWMPLHDPLMLTNAIDMAFVIDQTPEPTAVGLLALVGGTAALRRRVCAR